MRIPFIIPFKPINPKTRLSGILSIEERTEFAIVMLLDVIDAVRSTGCSPVILSTSQISPEVTGDTPVQVLLEGLNETIDDFCKGNEEPLAIVMADLALADRSSLLALLTSGGDLAIVPGRGGGTNAIYIRSAMKFQARYYGMSFEKHVALGKESDLMVKIIDTFRLYCDIDEKEDLIEVLIHNTGRSREWLLDHGFEIEMKKSRIGIKRPGYDSGD